MKQYIDGKYIKTHKIDGKRPKQSLKEIINRRKRAERDARLVQILTK